MSERKRKAIPARLFAVPVEQEAVSIESPSQAAFGEATQVRCRNFLLQEQEKSHSDQAPQLDQDETPAGNVKSVCNKAVHLMWSYSGKQAGSRAPLCTVPSPQAPHRKQQWLEHCCSCDV